MNESIEDASLDIEKIKQQYLHSRDEYDEGVRVGLFAEELDAALEHPGTLFLPGEGETQPQPVLVPSEAMEWFNMDLLHEKYGTDRPLYYYAHPPIAEGREDKVEQILKQKLDEGAVIFTGYFTSEHGQHDIRVLLDLSEEGYTADKLGGGDVERGAEVYASPVIFEGVETIKTAPRLFDVYSSNIEKFAPSDPDNGVSMEEVIEGDEAEEIWKIYDHPFEELGEDHPEHAGFDKQSLLDLLADPSVDKVVNRVNGEITTLCFFVQNFEYCPWFNESYYARNYPEYQQSGNVFMFPGIVSDETKRGNNYSFDVIDLTTRLFADRGSNILVTFECTETSAIYIPKIVTEAVAATGAGRADELVGQERASIRYIGLSK